MLYHSIYIKPPKCKLIFSEENNLWFSGCLGIGQKEEWVAKGHKNLRGLWKYLVNCIGFTDTFLCQNISNYLVSNRGRAS